MRMDQVQILVDFPEQRGMHCHMRGETAKGSVSRKSNVSTGAYIRSGYESSRE